MLKTKGRFPSVKIEDVLYALASREVKHDYFEGTAPVATVTSVTNRNDTIDQSTIVIE